MNINEDSGKPDKIMNQSLETSPGHTFYKKNRRNGDLTGSSFDSNKMDSADVLDKMW